jgi:hypothetical protein
MQTLCFSLNSDISIRILSDSSVNQRTPPSYRRRCSNAITNFLVDVDVSVEAYREPSVEV